MSRPAPAILKVSYGSNPAVRSRPRERPESAHLGHLDEARAELSRVLAVDPKLTIAGFRAYAHFLAPEVLELWVTGYRLAGLPE